MKKILEKSRQITTLGMLLFLYTHDSVANGYITPVGGPHQFYIDLDNSNIQNNIGYTINIPYDLQGRYAGTINCPTTISNSSTYYKAESSLVPSEYGNGYLKLNDFLDVKVEVWIDGNTQKYFTVPFYNVDNTFPDTCNAPSTTLSRYASGSKGNITFRVRKKIINGITINDKEIIEMYGRLGNLSSGFGTTPMAQVFIQSAILFVPDKCIVNEGQVINVEFGEISGTNLDGSNYPQNIPIRFQCEGGVFDDGALNISLSISGATTAFTNNALKTNKNNLGIQLKHQGSLIIPNEFYSIPMMNNAGTWELVATPLANGNTEIEEGDFNASATIVAAFQ